MVLLVFCFVSCKKRPKNCIVITIDTCRADRLGCYGYARAQTPRLDALAREGVLFEQCVAPVPITFPSHATLFSGKYPNVLGLRDNARGNLSEDVPTMADLFKAAGFQTAAFVAAFSVDASFGLDRGFDLYEGVKDASMPDKTLDQWRGLWPDRPANEVTDSFLEWLEGVQGPFFAWVHYFDPHAPYAPPAQFLRDFRDSPYDGEIAFVDSELGRVFDAMKRKGIWDTTLLCVTSDHGEDLRDHGEGGHSIFLYEATLHVPLIFRWPGISLAGHRVPTLVRLVDLLPTVSEIMGLSLKAKSLPGRSLVPALKGKTIEKAHAYAESFAGNLRFGWTPLRAIRTDDWKYVDSPSPELFYLPDDPREREDVSKLHREKIQEFKALLGPHIAQDAPLPERTSPIDPEVAAKLKQLGYMGESGAGSMVRDTGVVPKDMKDVLVLLIEARTIMRRLPYILDPQQQAHLTQQAGQRLMAALSLDPRNPEIALDLAVLFIRVGRYEEGIKAANQVLEYHDQHVAAMNILANCLSGLRRYQEALDALERAILLDPEYETARLNKILVLRESGKDGAAQEWAERLRQEGRIQPEQIENMLNVQVQTP